MTTTKLMLNCDELLWDRVKIYKIKHGLANMNDAVLDLIKRGLQ